MRFGIWALAALVLGAFGAHFLLQDRGYVLISFVGYNIEMSVPVLVLAASPAAQRIGAEVGKVAWWVLVVSAFVSFAAGLCVAQAVA